MPHNRWRKSNVYGTQSIKKKKKKKVMCDTKYLINRKSQRLPKTTGLYIKRMGYAIVQWNLNSILSSKNRSQAMDVVKSSLN